MHYIKKCLRPGCNMAFKEGEAGFTSDYCYCAALLVQEEIIEEIIENPFAADEVVNQAIHEEVKEDYLKIQPIQQSSTDISHVYAPSVAKETAQGNEDEIFVIDEKGYIHFIESQNEEEVNADKLIIYVGGQIYKEVPLIYDEMIVGRNSISFEPDVDLSEIDPDRNTSRKHLLVYKQNNEYFARNLSSKNSVHVESKALGKDEDMQLADENLIVLSRYVVMVFKRKK